MNDLFIYSHHKEICKYLKPYMSDKYYNGSELISKNSQYLMAFGEKSNGKSTFFQMVMAICFWLYGSQSCLIRLYDEDFKKGRAEKMFGGIPRGFISYLTKGKYDTIVYKSFSWYFGILDKDSDKYNLYEKPFAFRQCILNAGSSFQMPDVEFVFFDEFIRKDTMRNVPDEFIEFQTLISTIKRNKDTFQICMSGNTVNYFSTYFVEMGLTNIRKQKQGTIDIYRYGSSGLSVAVEYCPTPKSKTKESNSYFAFNNPKLEMITNGKWQLDIYPHLPKHYKPKDIILSYFIKFDSKLFQCDIVATKESTFTFIHDDISKTVDFSSDLIYMRDADSRINIRANILKPTTDYAKTITSFFVNKKVFYKNNEIGDIIHAYLRECA